MIKELTELVEEQRRVVDDPEKFGQANARFHERLVELTGNQTLSIVAEMLNEIVARAVTAVSLTPSADSVEVRERGIRSQERLITLIEAGRRRAGGGPLARAHGGRRQGDPRPTGQDRRRPLRPLLIRPC